MVRVSYRRNTHLHCSPPFAPLLPIITGAPATVSLISAMIDFTNEIIVDLSLLTLFLLTVFNFRMWTKYSNIFS